MKRDWLRRNENGALRAKTARRYTSFHANQSERRLHKLRRGERLLVTAASAALSHLSQDEGGVKNCVFSKRGGTLLLCLHMDKPSAGKSKLRKEVGSLSFFRVDQRENLFDASHFLGQTGEFVR